MLERIWGKEEPYPLQEGAQKDTAIMENSLKFFKELTELLYDPAILFLAYT